jgi:hypothetical protein
VQAAPALHAQGSPALQPPHLELHAPLVRLWHQHHAHVPLRLLAERVGEQLAAVGQHQVALLVEAVEVALYLPAVLELDLRSSVARLMGLATAGARASGRLHCRAAAAVTLKRRCSSCRALATAASPIALATPR